MRRKLDPRVGPGMKIGGRSILVTGASRGIGQATAHALAREGGRVALVARSPDVAQVASRISAEGAVARGYVADLTDPDAVDRVAQQITRDLGSPDIVVNNAGAGRWLYIDETSPGEVVQMMAAPFFAAAYVTRLFLPAMLERRCGYVVNLNSPAAWLPWPGATGYAAARGAMRGFTGALRVDLIGTGVRVLSVVPGEVSSTYFEHNPGSRERLPRIARLMPTLTPEDVAAAIVRGIARDRQQVIIPAMLRLAITSHALLPGPAEWLMWRTGRRRMPSRQT